MLLDMASIGLFPTIVLLILYVDNRKSDTASTNDRLLNAILLTLAYLTFMSFASWVPDGRMFPGSRLLLWLLNLLYFAPLCLLPGLWLLYLYSRLGVAPRYFLNPRRVLAILSPLLVMLLVTLSTPWTKLIFDIDSQNRYQRGTLFYLPYVVYIGYILYAMLYALRHARGSSSRSEKADAYRLACFTPFSVLGLAVQAMFYGVWIGWPLCSLSAVILVVGLKNRSITTDALTRLNNRRELERHLGARLKQSEAKPWCLMYVDVDQFKRINDRFGHLVGDEALKLTANVLRFAFGEGGAFLSRCGGDEFAVVTECADTDAANQLVARLRDAAKRADDGTAYSFSLSAGYVLEQKGMSASELMEFADQRMYEDKRRNQNQ